MVIKSIIILTNGYKESGIVSKYHLPAEEIRRIRRKLGETQAQFAKRLVVDAVTVARWETDQRKCTGLYAKTIAELEKGSLLSTFPVTPSRKKQRYSPELNFSNKNMSMSKSISIELSDKDFERLEAEAQRLNVPTDALASIMVKFSLTKVNPSVDALAALWGLAEIRKQLPPIDAVELARASRQDLEQRGVF